MTTIKSLYDLSVIGQALPALENTVKSLLRTNALVIQNVVDAARGRVISSLFPVKYFIKTLEIGETEYQSTLFDLRSIHYCYPPLE